MGLSFAPKLLISFIFLVLSSQTIHARDSKFFSKVTANTNKDNNMVTIPIKNNINNQQGQVLNKAEQDPAFIPETQNGYGLYGHDDFSAETETPTTDTKYTPYTTPQATSQQQQNVGETKLPENTSTNTKYTPYTTQANGYASQQQRNVGESETKLSENPYTTTSTDAKHTPDTTQATGYAAQQQQNVGQTNLPENTYTTTTSTNTKYTPYTTSTNTKYTPYTTEATGYAAQQQQNVGVTKLPENTYTTTSTTPFSNENNNVNQYYNNNGRVGGAYTTTAAADKEAVGNYGSRGGYGGAERQGMSDTRFVENGKYFYDVNNQRNYNPTQYQQEGSRRNEGNTNSRGGYYGNNEVEEEFDDKEEFEP